MTLMCFISLRGSREQAAARAKGAEGRAGPALPWSQRCRRWLYESIGLSCL